jgi:hypothetical protein
VRGFFPSSPPPPPPPPQCWYLNGAFSFFRRMSFHDKLLTVLMPAQYKLSENLRGCQLVFGDGIYFFFFFFVQLILLG